MAFEMMAKSEPQLCASDWTSSSARTRQAARRYNTGLHRNACAPTFPPIVYPVSFSSFALHRPLVVLATSYMALHHSIFGVMGAHPGSWGRRHSRYHLNSRTVQIWSEPMEWAGETGGAALLGPGEGVALREHLSKRQWMMACAHRCTMSHICHTRYPRRRRDCLMSCPRTARKICYPQFEKRC